MDKQHSQAWLDERSRRIKSVLEKAGDKKPKSYYEKHELALTLEMLKGFCCLHEVFCRQLWLFSSPEIPSRDMRRYAGRAMTHAAALGQTEKCEMLHKDFRPDIDEKDFHGNTGLAKAVERKRLGTAEWFLNAGANPHKRVAGNWNPILISCRDGCIPALRMFQHHGVDFNQPLSYWERGKKFYQFSKERVYPLEISLAANQPKATKALIEMGANPDIPCQKKGYIWRKRMDDPEFLEAIGSENRDLLREYFDTHPEPIARPKNIFRRIFTKTR